MSKNASSGLLAVIVIVAIIIFAGCVEKDEISPSTPVPTETTSPMPTVAVTPTPTPTPTLIVKPTPLETPKKANLSVLSVKFETGEFKGEYTINSVKLEIKNDRDESSVIDNIKIEISGDLPATAGLGAPESITAYDLEDRTVLPNEVKEIEVKFGAGLIKGKTYQVVVMVSSDCPPYYTFYETILNT